MRLVAGVGDAEAVSGDRVIEEAVDLAHDHAHVGAASWPVRSRMAAAMMARQAAGEKNSEDGGIGLDRLEQHGDQALVGEEVLSQWVRRDQAVYGVGDLGQAVEVAGRQSLNRADVGAVLGAEGCGRRSLPAAVPRPASSCPGPESARPCPCRRWPAPFPARRKTLA